MLQRLVAIFAGGLLLVAVTVPALGGSSADAIGQGRGNSGSAPGQVNAIQNCIDNIFKQNGKGQTGSGTGNATDPKTLNTAVTECDQFWKTIGAIGKN